MGILPKIKSYIKRNDTVKAKIGEQTVFFIKKTKFRFIVNDMIRDIKSIIVNDKFFKRFMTLTVVLEDEKNFIENNKGRLLAQLILTTNPNSMVEMGEVKRGEIDSGLFIIHLYVDMIIARLLGHDIQSAQELRDSRNAEEILKRRFNEYRRQMKSNLFREIYVIFKHEATHIETILKSERNHVLTKNYKRIEKLEEQSRELIEKLEFMEERERIPLHLHKPMVRSTKLIIDLALVKTYEEGVARYNSENFFPDIQYFHKLYRDAYILSGTAFKELDDILDKVLYAMKKIMIAGYDKSSEFSTVIDNMLYIFKRNSYTLGLHMVFTIKYALLIDDEELFSLSLAKFIKLYEEACNKLRVRPLITLTNGRGVLLDYKNTLRKLHRAEKG